ncbi:uncharacterized protein [Argopecten irradians]|uniref:uncharacterized protein n=1 Tax=Argopecten irradians TaxID=31199 RepID=UPI0037248820
MTLRIVFCNPIGGDLFSSAVVTTQEKLSSLSDYPCQRTNLLKFKHLWDISKLHNLSCVQEYQDRDQDSSTKRIKLEGPHKYELAAFRALEAYVNDFAYHQKRLENVFHRCKNLEKSVVIKVLYTHLFGPLGKGNCDVGSHIKGEYKCSCGCGREIKTGDTGLGTFSTWHGFIDMIIQEKIPVSVLGMDMKSAVQGNNAEEQEFCFHGNNKESEPYPCVHDKNLFGFNHLFAETITNAFARTNMSESLHSLPIPAFGCTPTQIFVYLYDCKNDILLKKTVPVHLLTKKDGISAVIMIWLYINFDLFMRRNVTDINTHPDLSEYQAQFYSSDENIERLYSKVRAGLTGSRHQDQPMLTGVVRIDKE